MTLGAMHCSHANYIFNSWDRMTNRQVGEQVNIPTGGPAGTTHFLSPRVAAGAPWLLARPSWRSSCTRHSLIRGKGRMWTRKWEPSVGRGTFWNAMWGLGFSCRSKAKGYKQMCYIVLQPVSSNFIVVLYLSYPKD